MKGYENKVVGIMQPYFLPYLGYWQLVDTVDIFVLYDNIKYTKKGWINRNRYLSNGNIETFTIPLKKDSDQLDIRERILAADFENTQKKLLRKIEIDYKKATYFNEIFPVFEEILFCKERNLFDYLAFSISKFIEMLGIDTKVIISSQVNVDHSLKSQDRVLAICSALNATHYVNPIGGLDLYASEDFLKEKIHLGFHEIEDISYPQLSDQFVENMSIIDLVMNVGLEEARTLLDKKTIKWT